MSLLHITKRCQQETRDDAVTDQLSRVCGCVLWFGGSAFCQSADGVLNMESSALLVHVFKSQRR